MMINTADDDDDDDDDDTLSLNLLFISKEKCSSKPFFSH
jgi:hypothetical protein